MIPSISHAEAQRDVLTLQQLPTPLHNIPATAGERYAVYQGLDRMLSLGYVTWSFASGIVGITAAGTEALRVGTEGGWTGGKLANALRIYPPLLREPTAPAA